MKILTITIICMVGVCYILLGLIFGFIMSSATGEKLEFNVTTVKAILSWPRFFLG
ncbi:hypothetical protein KAR91_73100 [Candidatus Pacearchaeota archaeon]|nr:hypothetical protein [Candidatus Pacearchaeota archaeon]